MTQYAIKPLKWSIDNESDVRLNPNAPINMFIEDCYMYALLHAGGERTEFSTVEAAQDKAQQLWEKYLKQYLEEVG